MKSLIAGVGYFNQKDLSLGPLLVPRLLSEIWPADVHIEDLSYGPVAVLHRLNEESPPFERALFVGAVDRGLPAGEITAYRWSGRLPPPEEVQERIGQALSGVVDLENLLIITQQFQALPPEVFVIEVQPVDDGYGLTPSPELAALLPEIHRLARLFAEGDPQELRGWPLGPVHSALLAGQEARIH